MQNEKCRVKNEQIVFIKSERSLKVRRLLREQEQGRALLPALTIFNRSSALINANLEMSLGGRPISGY